MKVIEPGYTYELQNLKNKDSQGQILDFFHQEPIQEGSTEFKTVSDGTTNEDLLAVLIDRLNFLQSKFPCRENALAITKLEESLMWLNKRTSDRQKRNVEGQQIV